MSPHSFSEFWISNYSQYSYLIKWSRASDKGPPKQKFCFLSRSRCSSERGRSGEVHSDAFLNTLPNARGLWLRVFLTATLPKWAGLVLSSQRSLWTCCRKSPKLRGAFGPLMCCRSCHRDLSCPRKVTSSYVRNADFWPGWRSNWSCEAEKAKR